MLTWRSFAVLWLSFGLLDVACTSHVDDVPEVEVAVQPAALVKLACKDGTESVYQNPGTLPPFNPDRRGDIVRCAQDKTIGVGQLQTALNEAGFAGVTAQKPVRLFRISYRTQRAGGAADVSSALVALPNQGEGGGGDGDDDHDDHGDAKSSNTSGSASNTSATASSARAVQARTGGSAKRARPIKDDDKRGPFIVYGHGTVPYRQECGYSRSDPLTATFLNGPDLELRTVLALASQGFPVIMPDLAGFVSGSKLSGYMFAEDEAYSFLDATRAGKKLIDDFPDQVVFVGHSQGGHGALSAQSYVRSYGMAGKLSGVVAYAPFWAPARSFGLVLFPESGYSTTTPEGMPDPLGDGYAINAAIEYFYTHQQLIDPGHLNGLLTFDINALIARPSPDPACNFFPPIWLFGTNGGDLLQDAYDPVTACAAGVMEACADPLAQTWAARFAKDRPALDPRGAPVLLWQGGMDKVVPVDLLAGCGVDKIRQDFSAPGATATLKACGDPGADHELIESRNAAQVVQWIKARTQGAPEPACPDTSSLGLDCLIGNAD